MEQETEDVYKASGRQQSVFPFSIGAERKTHRGRLFSPPNLENTRMPMLEYINASYSVYGNMIHIQIDRDWRRGEVFLIISLPSQCGTEWLKGILSVSC